MLTFFNDFLFLFGAVLYIHVRLQLREYHYEMKLRKKTHKMACCSCSFLSRVDEYWSGG